MDFNIHKSSANRFYEKWLHWPMEGWLEQFSNMGLIRWTAEQTVPIVILREPSAYEINQAH